MKAYEALTPTQKDDLFEFLTSFGSPLLPSTTEDMDRMYGGHAYTEGKTHWSIWREGKPVATLGAVTEARDAKGEVYLTGICVRQESFPLLDPLLAHALHALRTWAPCTLKLGAGAHVPGLPEWTATKGFTPAYRLLEMEWVGESIHNSASGNPSCSGCVPLVWEPLSGANAELFRTACNAAFLHSPNGGVLDREAVADLIRANVDHPMRMQLGYANTSPAITLQLELHTGSEGVTGVIDGLAVHPDFQGRGLGRTALLRAIGTLQEAGADKITLTVMDSNLPAVHLYQGNGFRTTRVLSSWFFKQLS